MVWVCFRCTEWEFAVDEQKQASLVIAMEEFHGGVEHMPVDLAKVMVGPLELIT